MKKGEIYLGKSTAHPIIFIKEENPEQFIGCIITKAKSDTYPNNAALRKEHFVEFDENRNKYKIQFTNSHIVKLKLIKKNDWGPFILSGKLSTSGIQFIDGLLKDRKPTLWDDYLNVNQTK